MTSSEIVTLHGQFRGQAKETKSEEFEYDAGKRHGGPQRKQYFHEHDGIYYPLFFPAHPREQLETVRTIDCQPDDVFVVAYPKSGTHWVLEIVNMLRRGRATHTGKFNIVDIMPKPAFESIPNPRVFASHLRYNQLPEQFRRNHGKTIYVLRNPKDVCVSLYNFSKAQRDMKYEGTWDDLFHEFLEGQVSYSSWFKHVRSWEKARQESPKNSILFVFYEDLHKNLEREIRRMAEFLQINYDESLIQKIQDSSSIDSMRSYDYLYHPYPREVMDPDHTATLFRKGVIGDWKHRFTKEQNREFDRKYEEMMAGSKLQFKYQLLS